MLVLIKFNNTLFTGGQNWRRILPTKRALSDAATATRPTASRPPPHAYGPAAAAAPATTSAGAAATATALPATYVSD